MIFFGEHMIEMEAKRIGVVIAKVQIRQRGEPIGSHSAKEIEILGWEVLNEHGEEIRAIAKANLDAIEALVDRLTKM